jgi:hypothetical protein
MVFTTPLKPVKTHTYTVTATAYNPTAPSETVLATLKAI